eukprot:CAMPEP_0119557696 /NCGR_PEP_ID=MMETSP1352-20130426/9280_1 /TAXON_ID=265584 /ORGANISM="Stauroneis constricta, Strain CCMP1120" /LENGTH=643 /DNA_ID=CAMNT_0007604835 /DNA_START=186 /DNA_END=2117 /DNA_ORIENTATION=-
MELTNDAIRTMVVADSDSKTLQNYAPVLQVLNLRTVKKANGDRFRVVLSDGAHFVQGMLATQINGLVNAGLEANCLIRVKKFMKNCIQGKNVIILLEADILNNPGERIGQASDIEKVGNVALAASRGTSMPPTTAPPMYPSSAAPQAVSSAAASSGQPSKPNPYNSSPSRAIAGSSNSRMMGSPVAPISRNGSAGGRPVTMISALNMYQNRWTIKARVVSKSDVRTWSNAKGQGSLFSAELLDKSKTDIRCTFFKEAVDKFYNMLTVGSVYTFSGGRLKVANMQYNTCKSNMEITFDQNAEIHLQNDADDIAAQSFDFVKIEEIEQVDANKTVDVIGVVQEIGQVNNIIAKKSGKEMTKRDVTIADDSGAQIRITLWGRDGATFEENCELHQVVAFRRARVSDYGGKTLSGSSGGTFVEPPVPRTNELRTWWESNGSSAPVAKSLSSSGGSGGSMGSFADRKVISDIKALNLGYGENNKADYLSFKAHFTFLKKDKEGGAWYTACPNKNEPCRNRCKVTQTTDGHWQCDRCQGTFPDCDRKWIFSAIVGDSTSCAWVSIFDEQATQLFNGATANEVFAEFENQDVYDSHFARAEHTEWIFKCRVKNEMVNEEPRLKTQVVRMEPVNYLAECNEMLAALQKMRA